MVHYFKNFLAFLIFQKFIQGKLSTISLVFHYFSIIPSIVNQTTENVLTILNRKVYKSSYSFQMTLIFMKLSINFSTLFKKIYINYNFRYMDSKIQCVM